MERECSKMYSCIYCCYQSTNKIYYIKHLFQAHNSETDFRYACEVSSCSRTFVSGDSFDAFRSHCTRYHHNWQEQFVVNDEAENVFSIMDTVEVNTDNTTRQAIMPVAVDHGEITGGDHSGNGYTIEGIKDVNDHDDIVVNAACFILNLKEKYKLSQVTLDFVTHSVEELLRVSTDDIKQHVLKTLYQQGIEITPPLFDKCFSSVNPFLCLKTEYQQTKFYKEKFSLIVRMYPTVASCS